MAKGAYRKVGKPPSTKRHRVTASLSPLDDLITDAIVDSRQRVAGALKKREIIKTVDEFVSLNGRRHKSWFHAGFRDALFDLPVGRDLPAQNEARARWYWAGAVTGLARSKSWRRLVELHDAEESVRSLGDGRDRASRISGFLVAKALQKEHRTSELVAFTGARLARRPKVFQLLLDAGTASLRSRNIGIAKSVFALLMDAAQVSAPSGPSARQLLDARRRMAHCMRLLDEHQGAEDLLTALLEEEQAPGVRAMLHADIGLLKGGFTLLDEVRIPSEGADLRDFVDRLTLGEEDFRRAVEDAHAEYACHGHYCLGVLALSGAALGEGSFGNAEMHLERAHAPIRGGSDYPSSLKAQTDLYLGIAKAHLIQAADLQHAAKLIDSGLLETAIPRHLIATTIEHLAFSDESIASVAGRLIESDDDDVLDALADTALLKAHAPLANALRERAGSSGRPGDLAVKDLRTALCGFLAIGDQKAAGETLDQLEQRATFGTGVAEFLELLSEPARYEPAWDKEDAAVASARCLEADGRYLEAMAKLLPWFHRHLSKDEFSTAEDILERIQRYGLDSANIADLTGRLEGASDGEADLSEHKLRPTTILVVGGNETQSKLAGSVEAKVAKEDPLLTVEFVHTGWNSNWSPYIDQIGSRIATVDGVVIMRFIRTTLGKHVRRLCGEHGVLWRFCYAGGQGAIQRAIFAAARAARTGKNTIEA